MPRLKTALRLLMLSSAIAVSACQEKRIAVALKPPPERLVCVQDGNRPTIPREYVIDWAKVRTVAQARSEHETYVKSIRTREGVIVGYIVSVEAKLFACSSNAQWLREWFAATSR